jgi:hypothetical protein
MIKRLKMEKDETLEQSEGYELSVMLNECDLSIRQEIRFTRGDNKTDQISITREQAKKLQEFLNRSL